MGVGDDTIVEDAAAVVQTISIDKGQIRQVVSPFPCLSFPLNVLPLGLCFSFGDGVHTEIIHSLPSGAHQKITKEHQTSISRVKMKNAAGHVLTYVDVEVSSG